MQVVDEEQENAARDIGAWPDGGHDDALGGWRRWSDEQVGHAAAVTERHRRDVLFDAVFEDLELVLLEVRNEIALLVSDDGVHGDQVDLRGEVRWRRTLLG